jgi:pyridoxal phosphate enzyme (YggS family)
LNVPDQDGDRLREVLGRNLTLVRSRIARAAERAQRDPGGVTLIVVTKTVGSEVAAAVVALGVRDLGENRVQAALEKAPGVPGAPRWHLVGHLQTNKVKPALRLFRTLHSLDSLRLLERIGRERPDPPVEAFVELALTGEATKTGVPPVEARALVEAAGRTDGVRLAGLMALGPLAPDAEAARPAFRALRELRDRAVGEGWVRGPLGLSMGMSGDLEVAIEEGATHVRVGTALFEGL